MRHVRDELIEATTQLGGHGLGVRCRWHIRHVRSARRCVPGWGRPSQTSMQNRSDLLALAEALRGLPIFGCLAGSPAAVAGVRYGDVLLSVDDIPTTNWNEFAQARSQSKGRFTARIFRDGVELVVAIELEANTRSAFDILSEIVGSDPVEPGSN